MNSVVKGTVEGTGSAINVELGFPPAYVQLFNIDDAGSLCPTLDWTPDMGAGKGVLRLSVKGTDEDEVPGQQFLSTGGITAYAGDGDTGKKSGFIIGTNAHINASAETIVYVAHRDTQNL